MGRETYNPKKNSATFNHRTTFRALSDLRRQRNIAAMKSPPAATITSACSAAPPIQ